MAWDADTDGDGICDGPIAPALPVDYCEAGPDAFPNDAAAYLDTDGDGMPDELWGESTTGLIEDVDDDNDGWTDLDELIVVQPIPRTNSIHLSTAMVMESATSTKSCPSPTERVTSNCCKASATSHSNRSSLE